MSRPVEKAPIEVERSQRSQASPSPTGRKREMAGILLLALALFLGLSVLSLQLGSGTLMGPCGALVATGAYALVGVGAYLAAACLLRAAIALLRGRDVRARLGVILASTGAVISGALLVHLGLGGHRLHGYSPGGLVGEYGAELLAAALGTAGTVLFALTGLAVSLVAATSLTMVSVGSLVHGASTRLWSGFSRAALLIFPRRSGVADESERPSLSDEDLEVPSLPSRTAAVHTYPAAVQQDAVMTPLPSAMPTVAMAMQADKPLDKPARKRRPRLDEPTLAEPIPASLASVPTAPYSVEGGHSPTIVSTPAPVAAPVVAMAPVAAPSRLAVTAAPVAVPSVVVPELTDETPPPRMESPTIVEPPPARPAPLVKAAPARPPVAAPARARAQTKAYQLPDLSLLDFDDPARGELDRQAMLDLAGRLERTLADYGVKGRVSEIHPGPVVTMYEFQPQAGTKLSKISALSNDLAMALEALKVRIVAPIPGKAAVGIEVPNRQRETVFLKEIVADECFTGSSAKLTVALGKDIAGRPHCIDLAKMPHLLVAGTTGSGKSVAVNAMICSLLMKATPEEVKLIMIDPKMLELSIYEGIPHLLLPVVTDPKKANLALRWAVDEMERRYELISKSGVRDIASYNKKVAALTVGDTVPVTMLDADGNEVDAELAQLEASADAEAQQGNGAIASELFDEISQKRVAMQQKELQKPTKLPYIVVIIDEFADLMMVASKDVETSVARIAQKARAAGIHLLLATQRPSVDVITGLIKANFPSRVAFQVASKIDARTILDQQGAESLLGMGDMLFMDRGTALKRVHGALVTDVEIHRVVEFLKAQGSPVYDLDILKPRAEDGDEDGSDGVDELADEMYDQAVALVAETRQASISMIQRRLRVGYNRAARMVERMERDGIVGAADGAKPREVLVQPHAA